MKGTQKSANKADSLGGPLISIRLAQVIRFLFFFLKKNKSGKISNREKRIVSACSSVNLQAQQNLRDHTLKELQDVSW